MNGCGFGLGCVVVLSGCWVVSAAAGETQVGRWRFGTSEDLTGWRVGQGIEDLAVVDGAMTGRLTQADAYLFGPEVDYPLDGLVVRVRCKGDRDGHTQIYWQTDAGGYGEARTAGRASPRSDDFITLEFPLGDPGHAGERLRGVRLDPYNGNATGRFAVKSIELWQIDPRYEVTMVASDAEVRRGEVATFRVRVRQTGGRRNSDPYRIELPLGIESKLAPPGAGKTATLGRQVRMKDAGVNTYRAKIALPGHSSAYAYETSVTVGEAAEPGAGPKLAVGPITVELVACAEDRDRFGAARLWRRVDGKPRRIGQIQPLADLLVTDADGAMFSRRPRMTLAGADEKSLRLRSVVDVAGGAWTVSLTLTADAVTESVDLHAALTGPTGGRLSRFGGPALLAGRPGADPSERYGLFPGLEFLAPGWKSSSERSIGEKFAERWTPHPHKITVPLMAIEQDGMTTGLLWHPRDGDGSAGSLPSATFASPNFLDGQPNHLMQLSYPGIGGHRRENEAAAHRPIVLSDGQEVTLACKIVSAADEPVIGMVKRWYGLYGTPLPPPAPHDAGRTYDIVAENFGQTMYWDEDKGWRHHWYLDKSSRNIPFMRAELIAHAIKTGQSKWLTKTGVSRDEAIIDVLGRLENRARSSGGADGAIQAMRPDGTYPYHDSEAIRKRTKEITGGKYDTLGEDSSTSLGTCVQGALPLIRHAALTADPKYVAAMNRALAAMKRFRVPRGAQVWEVHQQIPDIRAAALAVEAYRLGYMVTGEASYLEQARYWAQAGAAFLYSWRVPLDDIPVRFHAGRDRNASRRSDRPAAEGFENPRRQVSPYATIPVFGTTFYVVSWFGNVVQWCGLEWAWHVAELNELHPDPLLETVVTGVLNSGLQQTFDRPPWTGLYPDVWSMTENKGIGAFICGHLPLQCLKHTGRAPRWTSNWQMAVGQGAKRMVISGWGEAMVMPADSKQDAGKLVMRIDFAPGQPNEMLIARSDRPKTVRVGDLSLAESGDGANRFTYDPDRRLLVVCFVQPEEAAEVTVAW